MITVDCNLTLHPGDDLTIKFDDSGSGGTPVDVTDVVVLQQGETLSQHADARALEDHKETVVKLCRRIRHLKTELARHQGLARIVSEQAIELARLRQRLADRDQLIE